MKISFIIPIYNIENLLQECINSIISQTFTNIEIILVDDGSTDNSAKICDEFSQKDSRIKTIHKKNGGLSEARNTGLLTSTGEYIIFLDGDDFWVNKDCLQRIVNMILKNESYEFIGFNYYYYYPSAQKFVKSITYPEVLENFKDKNQILESLAKAGIFPMSACFKIIKRKFLIDNQLFFKKGITAEDIPWFINILEKTTSCKFVNEYIYAYRQNVTGSITNSFSLKSFDNLLSIIRNELTLINNRDFNSEAKCSLLSFLAYEFCILLGYLYKIETDVRNSKRKELLQYKYLLNYTKNPKVKKVSNIYRIFGIRITEYLLRFYLKRR